MSFIQRIITRVGTFLHLIKDDTEIIATKVNGFINEVKNLAKTPVGEEIVTGVEGLAQAFFPEIPVGGIAAFFKQLFIDLNWVQAEADKSDGQILADGLNYLGKTVGDVKASQLNTLHATTTTFITTQAGAPLPIQQALTIAQIVHDPGVDATV